ncbi:unnamed protein product [Kuraishia capsulata CBS 1993]|uniref:Mitochondrial-processing peptidase subunit alpha n=1 Tax=Kuraishia capsulata CBS 1993 TaxID=1382522 RepID=W6MNK8_9ASCO|nr:uncharacterized protein KUCA_T00002605001 [Kuraishia capsulata CBS 1993]CDK26632.1 unnamed protein product [Kuraishia capsulata CBS 1993]
MLSRKLSVPSGRASLARLVSKRALSDSTEPPAKILTTSNGIRLIVDDSPSYFSALGLYVDAGSRFESYYNLTGSSHLTDRLAFKSTQNITGKAMLENLNLLGGNFMCASSRESMMYQASVFNKDVEKMFHLLSETVSKPLLTEEEVQDQVLTAEYELGEINLQPDLILPELLQQVAYDSKNLGSPLLCPAEALPHISRQRLLDYRQKFYRPENLVVAMTGVPEDKAASLVDQYLGDFVGSPLAAPLVKEPAVYTGGELSLPPAPVMGNLPEFHHIYVGFEGVPITSKDVYALATLQMLIGGGGSFSAGGPGKGMYARAYTRILNQYGFVESCKSFIHNFTDSGLFGLSISCIPQANRVAADLIGQELALLFQESGKGSLTEAEVSRAKSQLKSSLMMNLESKMVQLEDMGRQVQVYGKRTSVSEMCRKIDVLTRADLIDIAQKVLTSSVPTVVIQGDRSSFGDVVGTLNKYGVGAKPKSTARWF